MTCAALEKTDGETRLRLRVFCAAALIAGQMLSRARLIASGLGALSRKSGHQGPTEVEQGMVDISVRHCFDALGVDWAADDGEGELTVSQHHTP